MLVPQEFFIIVLIFMGMAGAMAVIDKSVRWINKFKIIGIIAAIAYIVMSQY